MPDKAEEQEGQGFVTPATVFGENLRRLREDRQLSQQDVANRMKHCGLSWGYRTCAAVEKGQRGVSVDELVALGLVLGAEVVELLRPPDDAEGFVGMGDVRLDPLHYAAWLDGAGTLRLGDDGKTLLSDSDLMFEFMDRRGLFTGAHSRAGATSRAEGVKSESHVKDLASKRQLEED